VRPARHRQRGSGHPRPPGRSRHRGQGRRGPRCFHLPLRRVHGRRGQGPHGRRRDHSQTRVAASLRLVRRLSDR
jgi:hypothetical protein